MSSFLRTMTHKHFLDTTCSSAPEISQVLERGYIWGIMFFLLFFSQFPLFCLTIYRLYIAYKHSILYFIDCVIFCWQSHCLGVKNMHYILPSILVLWCWGLYSDCLNITMVINFEVDKTTYENLLKKLIKWHESSMKNEEKIDELYSCSKSCLKPKKKEKQMILIL